MRPIHGKELFTYYQRLVRARDQYGLFEAQTRRENNSKVNFAHVVTQATVCTEGSEHDDNDVLAQI